MLCRGLALVNSVFGPLEAGRPGRGRVCRALPARRGEAEALGAVLETRHRRRRRGRGRGRDEAEGLGAVLETRGRYTPPRVR